MISDKKYILQFMKQMGIQQAQTLQNRVPTLSDTEIIDNEIFIPEFNSDKQYLNKNIGFVVKYNDQIWKLVQPYDSAIYKNPPGTKGMEAFWGITHTKDPHKAKSFIAPLGTVGMYMKDECCLIEDKIYRSLIDNNVHSPLDYVQNWEVVDDII